MATETKATGEAMAEWGARGNGAEYCEGSNGGTVAAVVGTGDAAQTTLEARAVLSWGHGGRWGQVGLGGLNLMSRVRLVPTGRQRSQR